MSTRVDPDTGFEYDQETGELVGGPDPDPPREYGDRPEDYGPRGDDDPNAIVFIGSIASGASAWTVSGDDPPSAKLKLEIPASQFTKALPLMALGERSLKFKVTVED